MPQTPKEKKIKRISIAIATMLAMLLSMLTLKRREEQIDIAKLGSKKSNKKSSQEVEENDDEDLNQMRIGRDKNGIMWNYKLDEQGNAVNVNYHSGILSDCVEVPEEIDGHKVVSVGNDGENILNNYSFTLVNKIILPETVENIEDYSFSDCKYLKEVSIPEGITRIGENAFLGSENLENIEIAKIEKGTNSNEETEEAINLIEEYEKIEETKQSAKEAKSHMAGEIVDETVYTATDSNGITWNYMLDTEGNAVNVNYNSGDLEETVIVPESLNEHMVISVGKEIYINMFNGYDVTTVNEIILPKFLKTIEGYAFSNCFTLKKINIPDGVTNIGRNAFHSCSSLKEINIPSGVTSIQFGAFIDCKELSQINIPPTVISIGERAFLGCSKLTNIVISEGVEIIGKYAFSECVKLTKIEIPESTKSIDNYAFYRSTSLKEILIPEGAKVEKYTFLGYNGLIMYTLTDVNGIKWNYNLDNERNVINLNYNRGLIFDTVRVPDIINGHTVISIGSTYQSKNIFNETGNMNINNIILPNTLKSIQGDSFTGCSGLSQINIPDSVTSIGSSAFSGCISLTQVNIPNGVTSIADHAFGQCIGLTQINIPDEVTYIGEYAFRGCSSLTQINIPKGITTIEYSTFGDCISLKQISIPENVTSIGMNAFEGCNSLTKIDISKGVTSIGAEAFYRCSSLTEIGIPDGVVSIGMGAFSGCSSLTKADISDSVTSIGNFSFYECSSLIEVNIPNGVTAINSQTFEGCSNLREIVIPEGVTTIDFYAFKNCTSLGIISIPENVTSIGAQAFLGCSSLTQVNIPDSVTSIGISAFSCCNSLSQINIPNSVTSIGDYAFSNCSSLTQITMPDSVLGLGQSIFAGSKLIIYASTRNEIDLPYVIQRVFNQDNYLYANNNILFNNCSLSEDKTKLIVDENITNYQDVGVIINEGALQGLSVISTGMVTYSEVEWTKEDVTATLHLLYGEYMREGENVHTFTENGEHTFKYVTLAGEEKDITVNVTNIDKSGPSITVTRYESELGWRKESVHLVISAEDFKNQSGIKEIRVQKQGEDNSIVVENGSEYEVIENGTYVIIAEDNVGNFNTHEIEITNIDKVDPELEIIPNKTEWTKENIILTVNAQDSESGVKEVRVKKQGEEQTYVVENGVYEVTENGTYIITAEDNVGNFTNEKIEVNNIERIDPTLEVIPDKTEWTKENVTLNITAQDNEGGSGIKQITVQKQGEDLVYTVENGTYEVEQNGKYVITVEDRAGNTATRVYEISNIDKSNPTLDVSPDKTEWTKENVNLTISAQDNEGESGVKQITIRNEEDTEASIYSNVTHGEVHRITPFIVKNGKFIITAEDNAGNVITKKIEINNIDREDPTVEVTQDKTEWTKDNVTLMINAQDSLSGVKEVRVQKQGEEQTDIVENGMYEVSQNGTYVITVEDNAGNTTTTEVNIANIDRVAPELEVTPELIDTSEEQAILTVNAIDRDSEIDKIIIEKLENEQYKIIAYDKVGNSAEKTVTVKNLQVTTNINNTINNDGGITEEITFAKGKVEPDPIEPSEDDPVVQIIIKDLEIILKNGKKYVKVLPGFTTEELTSKMDQEALLGEVPEYTDLTEDGGLRTGSKIMLKGKEEYIVVVKGDIDGDGKVDFINDIVKINNYRIGKTNNLAEEQKLAGDINNNGEIDFIDDIIPINNYRLGKTDNM